MGKPYSMDLRERVVAAKAGNPDRKPRRRSIGTSTSMDAAEGGYRGRFFPQTRQSRKGAVAGCATPDTTLDEMVEAASGGTWRHGGEDRRVEASRPAWPDAQKNRSCRQARAALSAGPARQLGRRPSRTCFRPPDLHRREQPSTKRLRGGHPRRALRAIPHGHWKTVTFVGGLPRAGTARHQRRPAVPIMQV